MDQKSKMTKKVSIHQGLQVHNVNAAGIDIGDKLHCVAVSDGKNGYEVLTTGSFTDDLRGIVTYLKDKKVTTVAMESTGVYWLKLYLMLEEEGFDVYLVNAQHTKNVTGRKKDDTDAIWIQKLHTYGLLQKSFQPDAAYRKLRDYTRQRRSLVKSNSENVNRIQKFLELMNIKVHTVISDILGVSGMRIVRAILAGERNGEKLYALCDRRIKAPKSEILKSLAGIWKEEYLFMLKQAVEMYDFHLSLIKECEERIEQQLLTQVAQVNDGDITQCGEQNEGGKTINRKNSYSFPVNNYTKVLTGVDLTKIPGISAATVVELISEIGVDMSKWPSQKHFSAWLNLAPDTKISGGKVLSSKMRKKRNKAGQCLRQAASSLSGSKSSLGDYYRKMRGKLGGKGAVVATANKIAKIIYNILARKLEYNENLINLNEEKTRLRRISFLEKQLEKLKKTG